MYFSEVRHFVITICVITFVVINIFWFCKKQFVQSIGSQLLAIQLTILGDKKNVQILVCSSEMRYIYSKNWVAVWCRRGWLCGIEKSGRVF